VRNCGTENGAGVLRRGFAIGTAMGPAIVLPHDFSDPDLLDVSFLDLERFGMDVVLHHLLA
jgi:hypothetical protein